MKSAYIKTLEHVANLIDYAGNKMEAKLLCLEDGTTRPISDLKYVEYIGTRPGVELADNQRHGLFTLDGDAEMETEKRRLKENEKSIKWSQIISFKREDAERTGFDNRKAFQNLIRAKAPEIAKIYNISLNRLVVNTAYHDKDHHPHVHLVFYSTDKREGYVKDMKLASEKLRSLFFNEIFKEDVSHLKELKTEQRKEFDLTLDELLKRVGRKEYMPPSKLPGMLNELSEKLRELPGKKVYGFLPPELKLQVSEILNYAISGDKQLSGIYDAYCETQKTFISQYADDAGKIEKRLDEFRTTLLYPAKNDPKTLHNIIVKYAAALNEPIPEAPPEPDTIPKTGQAIQKENDNFTTTDSKNSIIDFGDPPPENDSDSPMGDLDFDNNIPTQSPLPPKNDRTVQKEKSRAAVYAATLLMRELAYSLSRDARNENGYYNSRTTAFHRAQVKRRFTLKRKRQPQRHIADDISY